MDMVVTARALALRAAARAEQEIRAYPRVYRFFYEALNRSSRVRRAVGRAKSGVRGPAASWSHPLPEDAPEVVCRREAAARVRLGLPGRPR
jgi:hypothetical protein